MGGQDSVLREWQRGSAPDLGDGGSLIPESGSSPSGDFPETRAFGRAEVEAVFRREHGSILASLIRSSRGDFFVAEDALGEALAIALERWPTEGVPAHPAAWIQTVAQRRLIDASRKLRPTDWPDSEVAESESAVNEPDELFAGEDDRLRLLFTCCHPALDGEARIALTLNALCGLKSSEIARAFLTRATTMAQRLVRAKRKIKQAKVPYRVPHERDIPERLQSVLRVIYLVFNEGYAASEGDCLQRHELTTEALELAAQLTRWMPAEPEVQGLQALLMLQQARRLARVTQDGLLVLLEDQDRSLWDQDLIARAISQLERALSASPPGPYRLQAAIAALHCEARSAADTDWAQIEALYDRLLRLEPTPVVELNRIVAVAMHRGPEEALSQLRARVDGEALDSYLYLHATRADLHRRLGQTDAARGAYLRAIELAGNGAERRFLVQRLESMGGAPPPNPEAGSVS